MTQAEVQAWISGYVEVWRSSDKVKLTEIFSQKVVYKVSPWKQPLHGLPAVQSFWEKSRSSPDEAFELISELVAVDGDTAVVRIEVTYKHDEPRQWRDLWVLKFDQAGRCYSFEEWPFSPEQEDGQGQETSQGAHPA